MRTRCLNPHAAAFPAYGGAGVTIDPRWDDFEAFLADMGERPSMAHSLDRIKNDRGYTPDNCRWATRSEQRRNQTRNRAVACSDGRVFATMIDAAEAVCGDRRGIRAACEGDQQSHRGLGWSYADE